MLSAALILPSSNIDASTALARNSSSSVIMPLLSLLSSSLFVGVGVGVGSSSKPLPLFLKPVASPDLFLLFHLLLFFFFFFCKLHRDRFSVRNPERFQRFLSVRIRVRNVNRPLRFPRTRIGFQLFYVYCYYEYYYYYE